MNDIIQCPDCQQQLQVSVDLLGKRVKCPKCGTIFVAAGPPVPSPPSPIRPADESYGQSQTPPRRTPSRRDYDEDDCEDEERDRWIRRDYVPHRGGTVLTFGILSLVVCGFFGPVAWIMGNNDMREIREGRMDPTGEGTTNAGRICGIIATCLMIVAICFYGFIFLLGAREKGLGLF